jgi:ERCC4-type nuclease
MKLIKPWIIIDTREQVFSSGEEPAKPLKEPKKRIIDYLMETSEFEREDFFLGMKGDGPGDFIIVDRKNRLWGIERKSFHDLYHSVIEKEADGKSRLNGQLAQLISQYGNKAVLMVHEYVPIEPWTPGVSIYNNITTAKRTVYSTMSSRSLVMPVWTVGSDEDAARYIAKMTQMLHHTSIEGRKIEVKRREDCES